MTDLLVDVPPLGLPPGAKPERKAPVGTITGRPALSVNWWTPEHLLDAVREYFRLVEGLAQIPFDPATDAGNRTRALRYCAPLPLRQRARGPGTNGGEWVGTDGLSLDWRVHMIQGGFVNPLYGRALKAWLEKIAGAARQAARAYGSSTIALLPCRSWEQPYLTGPLREANAVCFIRGRVAFINPDTGDAVRGNPYASMFVGFNVRQDAFRRAFEPVCGSEAMTRKGAERSACFRLEAL